MGLDSYDVARREGTLLFGNHVVDDLTDLRPERTHRVILQLQPSQPAEPGDAADLTLLTQTAAWQIVGESSLHYHGGKT